METLQLSREINPLSGWMEALCYLGIIATELGDDLQVESDLDAAIEVNQRVGDLDHHATILDAFCGGCLAPGCNTIAR